MGGAVFVIAALIGYVVAHAATDDPLTPSGVLVLLMMTGLALVGFIDDFLKIFRQTSLGLRSRAKLAGQVVDHGPFKGLSSYAETNELVVKLAADLGRQVAARASEAAPCESRCLHHQNGAPRCRYPAMGPALVTPAPGAPA
jgi:hypothetical protein